MTKSTTATLGILELGKPRSSGQMFVLASRQADGSCKRSYQTSWTAAKYRRLKGWLRQRSQHARSVVYSDGVDEGALSDARGERSGRLR